MHHCPYCGTKVKENELFCIKCGKNLPEDMVARAENHKVFNKYWYIPISLFIVTMVLSAIYYVYLQNQTTDAKDLYNQAEEKAMMGNYETAESLLEDALENNNNFKQADTALHFVQKAQTIKSDIEKAVNLMGKKEYENALSILNDSENTLNNYEGTAVTHFINELTSKRNMIKIEQLKHQLQQQPNIDELKVLLWEAEAVKNNEAEKITATIREQIVDYTFSKASEQLNDKQFSDAMVIVKDGLKYAPESEKLKSLKTTINKEKTAFETAQRQRIEQAINTAEQEQKLNKNNAVELVSAKVKSDKQGRLVVKGKVQSVATVPINTILVEYKLLTKEGTELLSNKVYVYPDTLYPNETGEFEFTHYDIDQGSNATKVEVTKIKWYTD